MSQCPRPGCGGLVVDQYGDIHCLICGWYDNTPVCDPITPNPLRSWDSVLCLCGRSAIRGYEQCRNCKGRARGPVHGRKISEGMAQARNRA
jgi:hypothetical protein